MKKLIIILGLFLTVSQASFAQDSYTQNLKKMFEVAGSEETYESVIKQMLVMFKQQYPQVEEEVWTAFEGKFTNNSLDMLTEMLVPVYKKYLTEDDIKGLIAFYQTPVGKKYAQFTPQIMAESMQVGQEWGMKLGQELQEEMQALGY